MTGSQKNQKRSGAMVLIIEERPSHLAKIKKDFENKKRLRGPAPDDDGGGPQLPLGLTGGLN